MAPPEKTVAGTGIQILYLCFYTHLLIMKNIRVRRLNLIMSMAQVGGGGGAEEISSDEDDEQQNDDEDDDGPGNPHFSPSSIMMMRMTTGQVILKKKKLYVQGRTKLR